jgi:CheY-like chemotaxis protein
VRFEAPANKTIAQDGVKRVLVVDDNVDAADSTALLLNLDGYDAHSVHSAQAALDAAVSLQPDVVLLDIGLPEMDGYDVAKRLRALSCDASTKIVALTGYGQPEDRARAARAGFDDFLVKPVQMEVLNGLLKSLPLGR